MRDAALQPPSPRLFRELLLASSRTFALGIERLREPLRSEVRLSYLLLRISDYLEDSPRLVAEERAELLDLWDAILAGDAPTSDLAARIRPEDEPELPDARVAARAQAVHAGLASLAPAARAAVVEHVRASTRGMARWARRGPDFADDADLDDYMHEVAGRVGYLLTDLFALRDPRIAESDGMRPLARSFGLGLQTVNLIRGLHSDRDRGWIYVPRTYLTRGGTMRDAGDLFGPDAAALRAGVLERLVEKARGHLDDAMTYLTSIRRRHADIRLFCALPLFYAERTVALSRSAGEAVFMREVKMTRRDVGRIGVLTGVAVRSNLALRQIARRLRR